MPVELNKEDLKNAVLGGCILGGGGGGDRKMGEFIGGEAFKNKNPKLYSIDEIDKDAIIITVSLVGAPAAKDKYFEINDFFNTVKILEKYTGEKIGGIITNENGGSATINGFVQSAFLDIPLIDCPSNGRAHPTGTMGSMNLHELDNYVSYQSFSGGNKNKKMHIEGVVSGDIESASRAVRNASVIAGGFVVVARNPVKASYVKNFGAVGAINHAIKLGEVFYNSINKSESFAIESVAKFLNGSVAISGKINDFNIETKNGFDVGTLKINNSEISFYNEYMTLEIDKKRLATFPDLIMTFDDKTRLPVTTAEIKNGMDISVVVTDKENIKLGKTMYNNYLLKEIENIINKQIVF